MTKRRTTTSAPGRVFLYARVSTAEQAEKDLSLPAQLDALHRHCKDRGCLVAGEFIEPGASGTDENRPEFQRMVTAALAPNADVDAVLVWHSSRFMRNVYGARVYKEKLRKRGVRVISISQETADDPTGHLVEGMSEVFDQYESELNGMRTVAAMRENARRGYFNGSNAPYGFKAERVAGPGGNTKRKLVPNAEEVPTHNEVFRQYVARGGAKAAARELNQRGHRYRKGKLWTKDMVLRVIDEEAAVGTYFWGRHDTKARCLRPETEWIPISVTPILDRELFDMAGQLRQARDPKRNPGRTPCSPSLLAGLIACGRCGASYQLETSGKTASSGVYAYRYYNCRSHLRTGKEACAGFRVRADVIESAVLKHLAERLFDQDQCGAILREVVEETGLLRQKTAAHRQQLQRDLEDIERRLRRWADAFENGELTADLGAERVAELQAKRDQLRETLAKVVPLRPPPPHLYGEATVQRFQESLRAVFLSGDQTLAKNYLRFLVEKIVVTPARVQLVARSDAAVRMMAAGGQIEENPGQAGSGLSPTTVVDWLQR